MATPKGTAALPVSCGTLIVNCRGELLLCHVTNTRCWDIPKGMQDQQESVLQAAMRELQEEAGIGFEASLFRDLGCFAYRPDKRLHLFMVQAPPEFDCLQHLVCSSFYPDARTGKPTPETDGFCWASRAQIARLCWPRMGRQLLALAW